jgi:hypothetical protein
MLVFGYMRRVLFRIRKESSQRVGLVLVIFTSVPMRTHFRTPEQRFAQGFS